MRCELNLILSWTLRTKNRWNWKSAVWQWIEITTKNEISLCVDN